METKQRRLKYAILSRRVKLKYYNRAYCYSAIEINKKETSIDVSFLLKFVNTSDTATLDMRKGR